MSNRNNQQQLYDQEQQQGVAYDDDSQLQDEVSQQYNQPLENHNLRYQQDDDEQQGNQQYGFIQNEDPQEEERVVRAQNQHISENHQQLLHQASNSGGQELIKDFQRQGNFNNEDQQKQVQNQGFQKQPSLQQQKLQQEQQNFQAQQQKSLLQKSKSQQDQKQFSQFLNEMFDYYKSTSNAFKAIDKQNKGFIELNDLGIELTQNFGIESDSQHKQIFVKLGNGNERITNQIFDAAFEDIARGRQQQKKYVLSSMNVVTQSYESRQSPFKDKSEREEIINIFSNNQRVNLEEANKIEHFDENCKYAPVVRRLRQQPTFNEFVRSYNSLQFPRFQQPQSSSNVYQPFSQQYQTQFSSNDQIQMKQQQQQLFLRHELFSQPSTRTYSGYRGAQQLFDQFRSSSPGLQTLPNGSPLKPLRMSAHTFSPNRYFQNFESPNGFTLNTNLNNLQKLPRSHSPPLQTGIRFLSPQFNRQSNKNLLGSGLSPYQSQIHGNQLKQSQGNLSNFNSTVFNTARNTLNNSRHVVPQGMLAQQSNNKKEFQEIKNQYIDFFPKSNVTSPTSGTLTFGTGNPLFQSLTPSINYNDGNRKYEQSPKLVLSTYLEVGQRVDLKISPTQNRLRHLKKKVNIGLESINQSTNRSRKNYNSHLCQSQYYSNNSNRVSNDQFNQYLSMLGSRKSGQTSQKFFQSSPQRFRGINRPSNQHEDNDIFKDILQNLSGTGSRTNFNSLEQRLNKQSNLDALGVNNSSPFKNYSVKRSRSPVIQLKISPTHGGIHGQMQRVRQIQASLRQVPNRYKLRVQRNDSNNKNNNYINKKKNINYF